MKYIKNTIRSAIPHLLAISFVLLASLTLLSRSAMAQIPYLPPGVETSGDPTKGFDPKTKENFYWDKDAHVWRNTKTLKAVGSYPVDSPGGSVCGRREISDAGIPYLPPGVETSGDPTKGFDPKTKENFYWDKDVHVWRNTKTLKAVGSYPVDSPGGSVCGRREIKVPEATTEPAPKPSPTPTSGTIDQCLVGTWRSESIVDIVGLAGKRGGSGIIMTIKADGTITIDYSEMQSLEAEKGGRGENNWWRGTASGQITTSNGTATITSVEKSEVTRKFTDPHGKTTTNPLGKLGPAAPGMYSPDNSYKCDETTLTRKGASQTFTFKREKKSPE